ncbi:MAG: coenzyme A pyrophosphatase [Firmicutes bacterium HGW-Firmicutes-15]|nr:MAG: coenzyme A pyrophosphatase [Firmicutes bacterium HGW-Firmicutes-15]
MFDKGIEDLRGRKPNILEHELANKSAVLLPLVKVQEETCILFEKRSSLLRLQPGEICFPGGGIESSDRGTAIAAVRETCEELGLVTEDVELIAPLDIMVTPFNAIIYPYVGYIKDCSKIQVNRDEVEEVFYVPVNFLLKNKPIFKKLSVKMDVPADFPFELIPHGKNYPFREASYPQHFYIWKDRVIWGMTARILNHFLNLLGTVKE